MSWHEKASCLESIFATPGTVAHQAALSREFSRPEYWSGLPCPPPGDLPKPGTEPRSPKLQLSHKGSPRILEWVQFSSVQFSSVAQSCLTLCDPMNCSTAGLPVHHQLPEFTQTHVHRVSDAIQPSHPLSPPSPPAPNPSQHMMFRKRQNCRNSKKVSVFQGF